MCVFFYFVLLSVRIILLYYNIFFILSEQNPSFRSAFQLLKNLKPWREKGKTEDSDDPPHLYSSGAGWEDIMTKLTQRKSDGQEYNERVKFLP